MHLGAAIRTEEFKRECVREKLTEWVKMIDVMSDFARTEPHVAYSAHTHCLQHRWNFMHTIQVISSLLISLENYTLNTFLPPLLRSPTMGNDERSLTELPPRLGGIGITFHERLDVVENLSSHILTSLSQRKSLLKTCMVK